MSSPELILVVDDTPANLEVVCETLSDAGYFVATRINGDRALKRVQAYPPDLLILLDVQMPGIDGFETCKRLKVEPKTASIPIIMNLLANAIDALEESNTGRSFAQIKANPNQITVKTQLSQSHAVIRIQDNGIGMTDAVKQKIFEHLFTTKGVGQGTGLGLAIARQIVVQKHSGTLEANSNLGEGTEFVISIPVKNLAVKDIQAKICVEAV
jgi:signal transduction histidine kinase